jgi:general secretion pathway protein J
MKNSKLTAPSSLIFKTTGGFTLLEVLIAFAITCIVLVALYSAFFTSHRAVNVVGVSLIRLQECRSVVDVIKRELESSLYDRSKQYTVFKLEDRDFYGKEASQLTFTSFSPLLPGLAKIAYVVEESDDKRLVLKKSMASAYSDSADTKGMDIMEDIDSFTVEARYNDKWVKTWDGELTGRTPDEIRISVTIRLKKGENPLTVSDIARPRIGRTI